MPVAGLREGCRLSPILWLFVIQAVLSLVEPLWQGSLQFRTCLSAHARTLAGTPAEAKGTLRAGVSLWTLLLADDMWVAADTRANLAANLDTFVRIGRAFGLEMHAAASPGADSKTLAMMVPAADNRTDQDLRDIQLEDGRTVPFATVVKYLGTMISSDWTDTSREDEDGQGEWHVRHEQEMAILEGCLGAGEGKVLRDVSACCLALWRRNMAANEAAEVKAADFPQHESPADGRGDEMAHPKVSDKDGGPGEASWAAAAGLVFGKPIAAVDRTCCANGSGEAAGKIGVWLGRHETQVGGAGFQPCQYDEGAPQAGAGTNRRPPKRK